MKSRIPRKLSVAETKAMNAEINKQLAENVERLSTYLQALVLWELREQLGFGKKRLLRFRKRFVEGLKELKERYCLSSDADIDFVCAYNLREQVGIDVEKLGLNMIEFEIKNKKKGDTI